MTPTFVINGVFCHIVNPMEVDGYGLTTKLIASVTNKK